MGRILEYVVLLSNLSLILGGHHYKEPSHNNNYERGKQENFNQTIKQYYPKGQNEFFSKRVLPLDYQIRRRLQSVHPKQMRKLVGLHAFASDDHERRSHKRNFSDPNLRNSNQARRNVPPFPQNIHQRKNSKSFGPPDFPSQKLSRLYNPSNSLNYQNKRPEDVGRKFHKEGRHPRYHPRPAPKICDPCNSVPWIPMVKVHDSYRQQRTHVPEPHVNQQQNVNFDYHGFASDTHNVLLPPVPLVPPIYDGTISSSFGLPIGNIPSAHGMLAPLNHLATTFDKYAANAIDYSSSFNYYSPHGLLESNPFPELSPVPVVPIHDSGQFYQFDSSIPDLVPPPSKPVDVSNVVLTISEENSAKLEPPKPPKLHGHKPSKDSSSTSSSTDIKESHSQTTEKNQKKDFEKLEIIKSIPLAEFTSSAGASQQELPLYPPLQSEYPDPKETQAKKSVAHSTANFNFLVPPPKADANLNFSKNKSSAPSYSKQPPSSELQGEPSAPKPLTSPSLSWLFSDHTAPPADSQSTASVLSFATETQEIASVVNNELRPVSPLPIPVSSSTNAGVTKSKKIQIIIPYTTKNKNENDNNALESFQHEVFQPPVSKSTSENNSLRDFATSALPPLTHQTNSDRDGKVTDGLGNLFQEKKEHGDGNKSSKYLSEMHHIIASNIRELLREEIEKSQSDQNYPLQNNIDNWTALEYSNHKTVGTKAPKEIITQALAVTSIPGTSISHLLLPSKKIPNEYFKTTPIPMYDEPAKYLYKTANSTVNSSPFTAKPYATTSVYNATRSLRENAKQNKENAPPVVQVNHERNYTEVGRTRVNNWGRLNENLVLPEARSKARRVEESTTSSWSSNRYVSSGSEKVQIVTPISLTTQRNHTTTSFRRTTRNTHRPENPTTASPSLSLLHRTMRNSTKLEKVSNRTLPFYRKFTYNSTAAKNVSSSRSAIKTGMTNSTVLVEESVVKTNITGSQKNQTNDDPMMTSKSEHLSINDIFPFRNKELPWESNLNASQNASQTGRQRKSLIKQANLPRPKTAVSSS